MTDATFNNNSTLAICSLGVIRGGRLVFEGMNTRLTAGEMLVLRGPNGSGKSTLIRALAGLLPPTSGSINFNGVDSLDDPLTAKMMTALSGHLNGMKPVLTLRQNLVHYADIMHTFSKNCANSAENTCALIEAAATALNLENLLDDELRYYSAGQLHRAGLTKLALGGRQLWLMDEPTVGLDAKNRTALATLIKAHLKKGGMVIAATHEDIGVEAREIDMGDFAPTSQPADAWLDDGEAA